MPEEGIQTTPANELDLDRDDLVASRWSARLSGALDSRGMAVILTGLRPP